MGRNLGKVGNIKLTRLAIVGSRDYPIMEAVYEYVSSLPPGTVVVSGGAVGVDKLAEDVARSRGLKVISFKPNWRLYPYSRFKNYAYFARNQEIVDAADEITAFWNLKSPGTRDTLRKALKAKKKINLYYVRDKEVVLAEVESIEKWVT